MSRAAQALNDAAGARVPGQDSAARGDECGSSEDLPAWLPGERPIDMLVNDLSTLAPELHEVMQGFLYVPIDMDPNQVAC